MNVPLKTIANNPNIFNYNLKKSTLKILKELKSAKRKLFKSFGLSGKKKPIGEFATRIKARRKLFWKSPDSEEVCNTIMEEAQPLEQWRDVENWQRKLHNKYNSREFAKKHGCKVPELYRKVNFNTLDFENLPDQYVIRPTMGMVSNHVYLMDKGFNLMDGKTYSPDDIRDILSELGNSTEALRKMLTHVVNKEKLEFLIEEFLRTEDGLYKIPADYKFYTFNGEIASIQVINRTGPKKGANTWYDENWKQMANITSNYATGEVQRQPKCFAEMKEQAKRLSKAYQIFSRVDFYATDKGAYFGEFTPTPASGNGFTPEGDKLLTKYWDQFCNGKV